MCLGSCYVKMLLPKNWLTVHRGVTVKLRSFACVLFFDGCCYLRCSYLPTVVPGMYSEFLSTVFVCARAYILYMICTSLSCAGWWKIDVPWMKVLSLFNVVWESEGCGICRFEDIRLRITFFSCKTDITSRISLSGQYLMTTTTFSFWLTGLFSKDYILLR